MDRNDLGRAAGLYQELSNIERAVSSFDAGDKITSLTIGGADQPSGNGPISIMTLDMVYPPQMIDAIKEHLMQRQVQIEQELTDLGLTGMPAR